MTTDITELAQREKFEAWLSEKQLYARYMHWCDSLNAYDYTGIQLAWEAYQAGGVELVEALEKAQQRIDELENDEVRQRLANAEHQLYMAELAKHNLKASRKVQFRKRRAAEKRIGELEESNAQAIQSRDHYKRMTEEGLKQLAESRTVKLPKLKMLEDYLAEVAIEERKQILVGVKLEFHRACVAAGIKWEAE